MNRLSHLRQTLPINLRDNQDYPSIEFIVLDYNSSDGLKEWIQHEMKDYLNMKKLIYRRAKGFQYFHHAHAKNIAHRLAQGKTVCNLDADNYTGQRFAEYLAQIFTNGKRLILRSPSVNYGTYGRIAMHKADFELIGGYDERMKYGWGYEDTDLVTRARRMGFQEHLIPTHSPFLKAIRHQHSDRTKHTRLHNLNQSCQIHKRLSLESISKGEYVANQGEQWGNICSKINP